MNKNVLKNKTKGVGVSVLRMLFLLAFEFVLLYPVIFMISNSFKVTSDTLNPAVKWFSLSPTTYGYKVAWMAFDYWNGLKITFLFGIVSGLIEVVTCAVYAYGLSRFELRFKKIWMFLLIVTILIPDVMLIIPRILNFRYMDVFGILGLFYKLTGVDLRVNITDTVWTFYLPSLFGVGLKGGLFIYIYMQFFKGLPKELEEAAWRSGSDLYPHNYSELRRRYSYGVYLFVYMALERLAACDYVYGKQPYSGVYPQKHFRIYRSAVVEYEDFRRFVCLLRRTSGGVPDVYCSADSALRYFAASLYRKR